MTTFDEWINSHEGNCARDAYDIDDVRDAYLAGLQAAAKLACRGCDKGYRIAYPYGFVPQIHRISERCRAENIHREIAEIEAKL